LLAFMGFAFFFSLGTMGGLRWVAYYVVPGFSHIRHTGIARAFWLLGGAFLAGVVLDRIVGSAQHEPPLNPSFCVKVSLALCLSGLAALLWACLLPPFALEHHADQIFVFPNSLMTAVTTVAGQLVLAGALLAVIAVYARGSSTRLLPALLIAFVVADAASHMSSNHETVCTNSTRAAQVTVFERLSASAKRFPLTGREERGISPSTDNLWAFDGKFYARSYLAATSAHYNSLVGNTQFPPFTDTKFLEVLRAAPRFWLTPMPCFARADDEEALAMLRESDGSGPVPVFIHESLAETVKRPEGVKPGTFGSVTIGSYSDTEVNLSVEAPRECWLFATERYAPGWKAYVDSRSEPVHRANFVFRAIRIPAGTHTVAMRYEPWLYKPLWLLSTAFTLGVVLMTGWLGLKFRRTRKVPHSSAGVQV
jgi:hypothetical protein